MTELMIITAVMKPCIHFSVTKSKCKVTEDIIISSPLQIFFAGGGLP